MDLSTTIMSLLLLGVTGPPVFLDDQFEMPEGFRIYRVAENDLSGGSYDIAFDARGRLLVGDGQSIRRLHDRDGDGVLDHHEILAGGLGPRGPQGLQVVGDRVYAVGGDGVQLYTGYLDGGRLRHVGRIGEPFNTGGDHAAHQILRGHDGHLYFITGDGGGTGGRRHITETSSPARFERACSVFRISPDGKHWECVGSGGRNAPNLGLNYLGELFSFDSDMEWHVDLPWWRPIRLNHWLAGGDQGWQGVGAYPPYYIDNLPPVVEVGRGSPDWGVFYEHRQLPGRYRDAFLVCDYLSKSATTGGYATSGQLYAFHLERSGAGWEARHEILVRPRAGARDAGGQRILFALVDIDVAPDGSVFLSDHNQGVWRLLHDPEKKRGTEVSLSWAPSDPPRSGDREELLRALLELDQPGAEWSRAMREKLERALGEACRPALERVALSPGRDLRERLRAVRYLAPEFTGLSATFLRQLGGDPRPELRAQAAWLVGLRRRPEEAVWLVESLLDDADPFVRRRTLEALGRNHPPAGHLGAVIRHLADPERLVRHAAMVALTHHPVESWYSRAVAHGDPQVRMRALMASELRREPLPGALVRISIRTLLERVTVESPRENRLGLLRVLGRFRERMEDAERELVEARLLEHYPDADRDIRHEQTRLVGEYEVARGFARLTDELFREEDPVEQFHIAQALSRIPGGWTNVAEERAVDWFLSTQRGWFSEFDGKGHQFPGFWATVLSSFASRHREAFLDRLSEIDTLSQLGDIALDLLVDSPGAASRLVALYRADERPQARRRHAAALGHVRDAGVLEFLRNEYLTVAGPELRAALLRALAQQGYREETREILVEGLDHPDIEVIRSCAAALLDGPEGALDRTLARRLLTGMSRRREVLRAAERLLVHLTGERRPGQPAASDLRGTPEDPEVEVVLSFWRAWYEDAFGEPFVAEAEGGVTERPNEEVHRFLLGDGVAGGDSGRGRSVFEAARCATCHGFPGERAAQGLVFGPDLAGVTRRLTREEIADALVYPSRQVAERFQAKVLQVKGGAPLTGYVTEETREHVTLVSQEKVHRVPRKDILFTAPQKTSLMPELLLNRLTLDEIRDLLAYLESFAELTPTDGGSEEPVPGE